MSLIPWKNKRSAYRVDDDWMSAPMIRFRSEMDQLFNRFFGGAMDMVENGFNAMTCWAPSLDVSETDTEVTVRAEVPGIDPKDLQITVAGNMLTIAGEKKDVTERKGENFYHSERRFGAFRRSVHLPAPVDAEKITAEHKNGLVFIRLKKEPGAVPKRIPVKTVND
jgi:HSP20 family protein